MFKKSYRALLLVTTLMASGLAISAGSPLVNTLEAYVVGQDKAGKETLKPAKAAKPNQLLEYQLTYQNKGNAALKGLVITGPIPSSTEYQADTAKTQAAADFFVSIDGGKTYESEPVKRKVKNAQGKEELKVIPASRYTHVRWNAKDALAAKADQLFTYRVKVK
jgi:uncharacterized repeat protein (TIGR01451 family)